MTDQQCSFKERVENIRRGLATAPSRSPSTTRCGVDPDRKRDVGASLSVAVAQEHRLAGLLETVRQLEKKLSDECAVRESSSEAMNRVFADRLRDAVQELEARYHSKLAHMGHAVETMMSRIEDLERELASERDKNARLTKELTERNLDDVEEIKHTLREEQRNRDAALKGLAEKFLRDVGNLNHRIDTEKSMREQASAEINQALERAAERRFDGDQRLVSQIRAELAALALAIDNEREERESGEEGLAGALESIVKSL